MNNEVQELILKAQGGDLEAKRILVENNSGLVYSIANRFRNNNSYQDIVQIGFIGLIKSINNFDFSFNVAFSTYAVPIILGEIKRYFRDEGQVKVSRSIKENYIKLSKLKEQLTQELDRDPTIEELAQASEMDPMDVTLALECNQYCASLDSSVDQDDGSSMRLEEKIEDKNGLDIPLQLALRQEVNGLEQREQLLLYYRYEKDMNQTEIAKILNLSQVQVSRLEKKIYQKLKERLSGEKEKCNT